MEFQLLSNDPASNARAGLLRTDHGDIPTPVFMPVGTLGAVKAVHPRELKNDLQAPIMLSNTYHLYLRPGMEVIEHAGGGAGVAVQQRRQVQLLGWTHFDR